MTNPNPVSALPPPPQTAPAVAPVNIPRRVKAAIIVQFILNEGADLPLSDLPADMQADLTHLLSELRYVDRRTVRAVVEEFTDELNAIGLSFPGDISAALAALDGKIDPRTAQRLRKEAGLRQSSDPWARISTQPLEVLEQFLLNESVQVAAVIVSKLDVTKAAQLLGRIPGEKARRITYAVSMTESVTPDAVDRIGLSLIGQIDAAPPRAFDRAPSERVGAILNFSRAATRDELLEALEDTDQDFAEKVKKSIFTFNHIPERLNPRDVPKITRDVDQDVLATIIAGAVAEMDKKVVEFLLANMSKRLAERLRDDASELDKVPAAEVESAMGVVVQAIRNLADSGEIQIASGSDET